VGAGAGVDVDGAGADREAEGGSDVSEQELLETINAKLDLLLKGRNRATGTKRFLSMREAARQLGISRDKALHDLIVSKRIRTVQVNGTTKIPASEIERVAQFGTDR
jgi:hypothetical protein